jgi:hypothetical protein
MKLQNVEEKEVLKPLLISFFIIYIFILLLFFMFYEE